MCIRLLDLAVQASGGGYGWVGGWVRDVAPDRRPPLVQPAAGPGCAGEGWEGPRGLVLVLCWAAHPRLLCSWQWCTVSRLGPAQFGPAACWPRPCCVMLRRAAPRCPPARAFGCRPTCCPSACWCTSACPAWSMRTRCTAQRRSCTGEPDILLWYHSTAQIMMLCGAHTSATTLLPAVCA